MLRTLSLITLCGLPFLAYAQDAATDFANTPAMQTLMDDGEHTKKDVEEYKDLDQDGVPDKDDFCANTAKGTKVDKHGCELDSDGDGIYDKTDQCPNTPPGVSVNFLGCEGDEDKDGVVDSQDKCPSTPLGTKVNQYGCALNNDKDGDGVIDSLDQCPNTPKGYIVNKYGCPPQTKITIQITFPVGSWNIPTDQKELLEKQASKLKELQPDEVVLISGFTDNSGKADTNMKLSWERANSVKDYILNNFSYPKDKFYIMGMGDQNPIASNATKEGREHNRRIEFQVLKLENLSPIARHDIPAEMRLKK
ncbi:MAG: OmpA family protein [Thiotrichales bacterium]|nr:OmpA family protein [Thiotrichales bacterium]